eukprot:TRINITY_DN16207_c0_g1_i3.p1 TRINITY_DN16207_c0_g1~~TRINITY_DN16207_c0_g1_i3.p1  ORF type:complete len:432 (+),score=71.61 TRINITY_DN16207_c0_g1_i3:145-1440(+)
MEKGLISVDRWDEQSQAYFLTHLHADHTQGLSHRWKRGPLFCSPITSRLFPARFPGFNLSLIRVLEIGSPHLIYLVSPSSGSEIAVRVTAIDAVHCPGAVMYLFCGEFGSMLYTGDFRWEANSDKAHIGKSQICSVLQGNELDFLYLDNTYCNPLFSFPPRDVVAQQVVDIIASHPDYDIIIGLDTLGKEELLLHISCALKTKIWVWPERLQTMHLLELSDVFTTNTALTRVRAVPRYCLTINNLEGLNSVHPTIGIVPSGLPWVRPVEGKDSSVGSDISVCCTSKRSRKSRVAVDVSQVVASKFPKLLHQRLYSVPYSDHSCFSELQEFIKFVKPAKMRGIVSSSVCYVNPSYYFRDLCEDSQYHQQVDQSSESVEVIQSESFSGCNKSNVARGRKSSDKVSGLGVRKRRVSISRRERIGARIAEMDSTS